MKKILATVVSFALLLSVVIIPVTAAADLVQIPANQIEWDGVSSVNSDGHYMRTKELSDGTVAGVWYVSGSGAYFAISYDGGITFPNKKLVAPNTSWSDRSETDDGYGRIEVQNPNIVEMTDGRLMMTYRYNTFTTQPESKPWTIYYTSICYRLSADGGATWGNAVVVKENFQTSSYEAGQHGYWEPDPVYIGDNLFLYFADTVTNTNLGYQNILGCQWNGNSFGETFIAQNGKTHSSRDGMSVVTKLLDGTYAMVFESTNTGSWPATTFVIKISKSTDGINWSEPAIIASPDLVVPEQNADEDGARAVCAAPYIITLPDGRVAVSCQTTDLYNGTIIPTAVGRRSVAQVIISNEPVNADTVFSENLFTKIAGGPVEIVENQYARAASLRYTDGKLLCYYNTGVNIENEGVLSFDDTGIKVSYCDVQEETIDGTDIENYKIYNSVSKTVTSENGSFTMPTGCTNMIYADTQTKTVTTEQPVDGLYNGDNYETDGSPTNSITFDSENSAVINNAGTMRSYIVGTEDMTSFRAQTTIQGNSKGEIYAGFGFHMQTADFFPSTYNFSTSGYTVIITRTAGSSSLNIMVRFITGKTVKKEIKADNTFDLLTTAAADKVVLTVWADEKNFYITATNEDGTKSSGTLTYALDSSSVYSGTSYYPSGAFALTANGINTFTNFSLSDIAISNEETVDIVKTADLIASAKFTLPTFESGSIQTGFNLRVQQAANAAPGLTGYALKLIQDASYADGTIKLQLTRYGKNSSGVENKNLGDIKTYSDTNVLGGSAAGGQTVIMSASIRDNLLSVRLENNADSTLYSLYEFDLSDSSTSSSVVYNDYYDIGGFGFFHNGNYSPEIREVSFEALPKNLNKIETGNYTVYAPEGSKLITAENAFVSNDSAAKKIILNNTVVNDFNAEATFKIGSDGNLKAGIIFRAQNFGDSSDEMEGYSCVLYKTPNTTNNSSRIVTLVYKWARQADGTLTYLGTLGSKVDIVTLASAYPDTETSLLSSADIPLKLNLTVDGTTVTSSFDVFDENNQIAVSSAPATFSLTATPTGVSASKEFTDDAYNTVFNAGSIGLSISSKGEICDFNMASDGGVEVWDTDKITQYSSNTNEITVTDNTLSSITGGYKQAIIPGIDFDDITLSGTFLSSSSETCNMGFDFFVNEATHADTVTNTSGFEGYRLVLVRGTSAGVTLYLYKFTLNNDNTYLRTEIKTVSSTTFFSDYTNYGNIEVDFSAQIIDGNLTATAFVKDYPNRAVTLTAPDITGSGTAGCYICNGGSIINPSIKYPIENSLINSQTCESGFVYAALNSGAANVGDQVKIVPVAAEGYQVSKVYATVGDIKTEIPASDNGYIFEKDYGETLLSADFVRKTLVGDLDLDGYVNGADMVIMRRVLLGYDTIELEIADLNGDKLITVKDLVRLKKYVAGIIAQ